MVIVCGEVLVDLVPAADGLGHLARPGGSPGNVAVGLSRLGVPTELLTRLSTDHFGQMVRRHLRGSGVGLALSVESGQPSTVALVRLDGTGQAEYLFTVDGTGNDGWTRDAAAAQPARHRAAARLRRPRTGPP